MQPNAPAARRRTFSDAPLTTNQELRKLDSGLYLITLEKIPSSQHPSHIIPRGAEALKVCTFRLCSTSN
jgi:hypothetical protein